MRLKKKQREAIIKWVASGMQSDEINRLASDFKPPFSVSRQQVDYYRQQKGVDLKAIQASDDTNALQSGLALRSERVKKLKMLAERLEIDIMGSRLWLEQMKGIGSGFNATIFEYEEFNRSEVDAYRGILDDIAKEVGDRVNRQEHIMDKELLAMLQQASPAERAEIEALFDDVPNLAKGIEA